MFRRICSLRELTEAGTIRAVLESCGVHPAPLETAGHVTIGGADTSYFIAVPEEEMDRARDILVQCGRQKDLFK